MDSLWIGDERTERQGDRLAFIFLGLTQLGLLLAIVYQRYVLNLPPPFYNDAAIIMIVSMLGYWCIRIFYSGLFAKISLRQILAVYLTLVAVIAIPHTLVHGLPVSGQWTARLVPILGGPAALLVIFYILAYFGNKWIEKKTA